MENGNRLGESKNRSNSSLHLRPSMMFHRAKCGPQRCAVCRRNMLSPGLRGHQFCWQHSQFIAQSPTTITKFLIGSCGSRRHLQRDKIRVSEASTTTTINHCNNCSTVRHKLYGPTSLVLFDKVMTQPILDCIMSQSMALEKMGLLALCSKSTYLVQSLSCPLSKEISVPKSENEV